MHYLEPQPIKSIQFRVASVGLSAIIIISLLSSAQLAERLLSNYTGGALSYRMFLQHQMDQGWYMFMQPQVKKVEFRRINKSGTLGCTS